MASHRSVQEKLGEIEHCSIYEIAGTIVDLEAERDALIDERDDLKKRLDAAEQGA